MKDKKIKVPSEPLQMVDIKIIEKRGESALVEWLTSGIRQRGYIPIEAIAENQAPAGVLVLATPHGLDILNMDIRKFSERLHAHDIWTQADLRQKYRSTIRCLFEAIGVK